MITDKKHVSPVNYLVLNKAKKMLLVFGKTKIHKWFSDSEETYEELANKTDLNTLAEEVSRYEKSFFVVRIFQRLFTSIQTKRTLLAYMETRKFLTPLEISKNSNSFKVYVNFIQQRIEQISYFSPLRSTLRRISNFFVKKSFIRKKVKLRTNNMQHKHINLMINKISDLHEEIMLLLLSLSKQNNYSKAMKLYQEWKQLSIKYMRDLKDPLEIKSFKEHHSLCEQNIMPKLAQYADQLEKKEFKRSSISVVQEEITKESVKASNLNNGDHSTKQMPAPHCKNSLKPEFEKDHLPSMDIQKQDSLKKEEKIQNTTSVDLIFDEEPKPIEVDYELNLLHCFSDALKEMENFMKLVKKNASWNPQGKTEQKEITHFKGELKKILIRCHPDKNPILLTPLAEDNFKNINEQIVKLNNLLEKNSREIFIEDFPTCINAIKIKKIAEEKSLQIYNQRKEESKQEKYLEEKLEGFAKKLRTWREEYILKNEIDKQEFRYRMQQLKEELRQQLGQQLEQQLKQQLKQELKQQFEHNQQMNQIFNEHNQEMNRMLNEHQQRLDKFEKLTQQLIKIVPLLNEQDQQLDKMKPQNQGDESIVQKLMEFFSDQPPGRHTPESIIQSLQINSSRLQGQGLFDNLIPGFVKTSTEPTKISSTMSSTEEFSPKSLNVSAYG